MKQIEEEDENEEDSYENSRPRVGWAGLRALAGPWSKDSSLR